MASERPFLLHNVDVISTIDLQRMVRVHTENQALATLAVQDRKTSRYLLFDENLQLCGRRSEHDKRNEFVRFSSHVQPLAFSGIHVISPRLFALLIEEGPFSIISAYLRLAGAGEKILGLRSNECYWRDLGSLDNLTQAARDVAERRVL